LAANDFDVINFVVVTRRDFIADKTDVGGRYDGGGQSTGAQTQYCPIKREFRRRSPLKLGDKIDDKNVQYIRLALGPLLR